MVDPTPLPETLRVMRARRARTTPPLNLTAVIKDDGDAQRKAAETAPEPIDDMRGLPSEHNPRTLDFSLITDPPKWLEVPLGIVVACAIVMVFGFCWMIGQTLALGLTGVPHDVY